MTDKIPDLDEKLPWAKSDPNELIKQNILQNFENIVSVTSDSWEDKGQDSKAVVTTKTENIFKPVVTPKPENITNTDLKAEPEAEEKVKWSMADLMEIALKYEIPPGLFKGIDNMRDD